MNPTELGALTNNEAELGVVGLMLADQNAINIALRDGFTPEYIHHVNRKAIAETIVEMHGKHEVVDLITVTAKLRMEHPLISADAECTYCVDHALVSIGHLSHYIGLLRELYHKRQMMEILKNQLGNILTDTSSNEISSQLILDVSRIASEQAGVKSYDQMVTDVMAELNSGQCLVVPCKSDRMRRKIGGFPRSKPTVVAARPGTGKSTFMCNEISWQAQQGFRVGVLSLEMTREELYMIMACERLNISTFELKRGRYDFAVRKQFEQMMREFERYPLWVADRNMTINQIVSWIKTMVTHNELDIVYLDYIQRIRSTGKIHKRYDEVSQWAHMLTDACKETGVALVELCQISRAGEPPSGMKEEDAWKYVPRLHHLKETGALEEDAYLAVLLYPSPGNNILDGAGHHIRYIADVAKHRGGPIGHVELVYYKDKQRFAEPTQVEDAPAYSSQDMFDPDEPPKGELPF